MDVRKTGVMVNLGKVTFTVFNTVIKNKVSQMKVFLVFMMLATSSTIGLPGKDRNEIVAAISKAIKATFGYITFSLKGSSAALKDVEIRLAK